MNIVVFVLVFRVFWGGDYEFLGHFAKFPFLAIFGPFWGVKMAQNLTFVNIVVFVLVFRVFWGGDHEFLGHFAKFLFLAIFGPFRGSTFFLVKILASFDEIANNINELPIILF